MAVRSVDGERIIPAAAFFESAMATSLAANECLTEVRFPIWQPAGTGHGFHEVSIRDSDFALAAAAAQVTLDSTGNCNRIHVAIGGASPVPMRLDAVEAALLGTALDDDAVRKATDGISALVEPQADVHADAAYRRRVARVMAERAIRTARDRAGKATA
jgi:carbon-monoxide dehydrogenase medium subunit